MAPTSNRFSLKILMAFIAAIALGMGGMRVGSSLASRTALAVVEVALLIGLLGMIVRRGEAGWLGFTLFGWTYFALSTLLPTDSNFGRRVNPGEDIIEGLVASLHPGPGPALAVPSFNPQFEQQLGGQPITINKLQWSKSFPNILALASADERKALDAYVVEYEARRRNRSLTAEKVGHARAVGHALFALLFALLGAISGRFLERSRPLMPAFRMPENDPSMSAELDAGPVRGRL